MVGSTVVVSRKNDSPRKPSVLMSEIEASPSKTKSYRGRRKSTHHDCPIWALSLPRLLALIRPLHYWRPLWSDGRELLGTNAPLGSALVMPDAGLSKGRSERRSMGESECSLK